MAKRRKWQRPREMRRRKIIRYWNKETGMRLYSSDTNTCPYCGGPVMLPPAIITSETDKSILNRLDKTCHLIEVRDEGRSTIGYSISCMNTSNFSVAHYLKCHPK